MLEFRAGKMFHEGTRVVPDTRKGLVRIGRVGLNLMKFMPLMIFFQISLVISQSVTNFNVSGI